MSIIKHTPVFTVIIPVYNRERTIMRCMKSIQQQTFKDWECIVVIDKSPDRTTEFAQRIARADDRFRIIEITDRCRSIARNVGIEKARGKYICFCDSDDSYLLNKLSVCYEYIQKYPDENIFIHSQTWTHNHGENNDHIKKYSTTIRPAEKQVFSFVNENKKSSHDIDEIFYINEDSWLDNRILNDSSTDDGFRYPGQYVYKKQFLIDNNLRYPAHIHWGEDLIFGYDTILCNKKFVYINKSLYKFFCMGHDYEPRNNHELFCANKCEQLLLELMSYKNLIKFRAPLKTSLSIPMISDFSLVDYLFVYNDKDENMLRLKLRSLDKYYSRLSGIVHIVVPDMSYVPEWLDTSTIHLTTYENIYKIQYNNPLFDIYDESMDESINDNTIYRNLHNVFGMSGSVIYSTQNSLISNYVYDGIFFKRGHSRFRKNIKSHSPIRSAMFKNIVNNPGGYKINTFDDYKKFLKDSINVKYHEIILSEIDINNISDIIKKDPSNCLLYIDRKLTDDEYVQLEKKLQLTEKSKFEI